MNAPRVDRVERHPVLIVGAGIAGFSVALNLPQCTILTRGPVGQGGSTAWAQGGIAAAVDAADSAREHAQDTLKAGAGLVDPEAAKALTEGGRQAIDWLVELGAEFDQDAQGHLELSREGGHGRRRVVHAEGDATGAEILRALATAAKSRAEIRMVPDSRAIDLATQGGRVVGVYAVSESGERTLHLAPCVVLATGGASRVFSHTTNPPEATGDGIAMAARAGATLADMEFEQFHPTALDAGLDPLPLLTEALRGEGATLLNRESRRFMEGVHPDRELAPRDVVARAIWAELQNGRGAFLDVREVLKEAGPDRFLLCRRAAKEAGLDPERDLLPVSPAAHYHIGGVAVDLQGRSSLPGLWAVGECSSTGVHGANRLASNSLLEGVVFGRAAARAISEASRTNADAAIELPEDAGHFDLARNDAAVAQVRLTMWEKVGLVRDEPGLQNAVSTLESISPGSSLEARNLRLVGELIARSAVQRHESRGTHFRADFPTLSAEAAVHSLLTATPVARIAIPIREASSSR